jgi:hypothetical protein
MLLVELHAMSILEYFIKFEPVISKEKPFEINDDKPTVQNILVDGQTVIKNEYK